MTTNYYINDVVLYQNIAPVRNPTFTPADIAIAYTPQVTSGDILAGEMYRYFCRPTSQSSPSEIQEIDQATYTKLMNNNFYLIVQIRWKIKGPLEDSTINPLTNQDTGIMLQTGVITANTANAINGDLVIPGLKYIITDFDKFWQGD